MKQHEIFLYILISLSLFLCLRYLGRCINTYYYVAEGFIQKESFILKQNENKYDDFYAKIYDTLHLPQHRVKKEIQQVLRMTHPSIEHSCFLDIGSGTGTLLNELTTSGFRAFGIESAKAMVDCSLMKYPEIQVHNGDVMDTLKFESGTFTHIICNYFTIYHFQDKILLFKNCFKWLTPGGYLLLHIVDPNRFDTIIPSGKPLNIDSPQKYTNKRILETFVELDGFNYKSKYDISLTQSRLLETFTDVKTNKVRQNEQQFFMESKEMILGMCTLAGFILHAQVNYDSINGDPYQFLIVVERPM
jgi:SAM-dependent methyltransferase